MNIKKNDIQQIKVLLTDALRVDFFPYKNSTVTRRVEKRMKVFQFDDTKEYIAYLKQNEGEIQILGKDIFINVTDFFRDPHVFQKIKHKILPSLFKEKAQAVKVWVAGCATGEEAYSFAILIKEFCEEEGYKHKIKIIATDIKEEVINKARQGLYNVKEILGVNQQRLRKFFDREGDKYRIKKQIRSEVIFAIHDMTSDPPFARVDLLSCRNLLIYLDKENQQKVLSNLVFALNIEGFLVLGKSETAIDLSYDLKNVSSAYKIYKRIKSTRTNRRLNFDITYQDNLLPPLLPPSENVESMKEHELAKSFQHIIHQKYAPAVVIIDEQFYVKHITRAAKQYIDTPEDFTKIYSLLDLAHESITAVVRAAIAEIKKDKKRSTYPVLPVTYENEVKQLSVSVELFEVPTDSISFYAILFEENRTNGKPLRDIADRINLALQDQLADTEENLRKTIGKLENTNQNLLASNEELQSTNEEYISVNEELQTINSEYQDTINELSISNKDVDHLLQSTDIGTLFLDDKLHIRKFTNPIKSLINIDDIDLKRPLKNFTYNLKNINLVQEVESVLNSNKAIEKEVVSEDDTHYLMRATPYDVDEENRKGIVLSFINVQQLKNAEKALAESELLYRSVFDYANDGIVLFDENEQKVSNVNQRQLDILGYNKKEYLKTTFLDIFAESQSDRQEIQAKIRRYTKAKNTHHAIEWTLKKKDNSLIETEISTVNMPPPYEGYTLNIIRDVTQKKQAQLEILASQKRFEAVFDNCPIGVGISNMKFNIIRVNKTFGRMTGYTPKQLSQMSFVDITYHEDRKPDKERLQLLISGKKKIITFDKRYVKKNGNIFWARLWVSIMDDGSGEKFFVSSMRDISKEKEAEQKLQDRELRYRSLFEKNIEAVIIYDVKNNKILSVNKSACKLFECSKKYLIGHTPMDFFPEFQENGEPSIQFFGKKMQIFNEKGEVRHFMQLQTKKGKPIEVEVTTFRLDDSPDSEMVVQFKDITTQKNAQQALQESEQRFRSLFENSGEAILIGDIENIRILNANSKMVALLGFSEKELQNIDPSDILPELQSDGISTLKHIANYAQDINNQGFTLIEDFLFKHKNGTVIHTEVLISKLYHDHTNIVVGAIRDITEKRATQQAIKESEQRFRSVYQNSGEAILLKDLTQQKVTQFNSKFTEMTGYTEEDFHKLSGADITLEPQADGRSAYVHHEEHMQVLNETGYCFVENWLLIHKDGHIIRTNMSLSKLYDDRDDAIIIQFRDVTEKYQAQQAIKESEQRFRNLFENSAIGIGIFDIEKMVVVDCNQQFARLHDMSIEQFKKTQPQDITADIQADGRDTMTHLKEQIETVIKNGSLTVNNWLCKRKDGTIFHAEVTLNILNEATPNIIFVHMRDITEKYQAQQALQKQKDYLNTIINLTPSMITVKDTEGNFVLANQAATAIYGVPLEDLIGKNRRAFGFGFGLEKSLSSDKQVIKTGEIYQFDEVTLNMANGEQCHVQVTKVPLKNEEGAVIQVLAIANNITEIKTAEKLLKEQKDYLRTIIDLSPNYIFSKDKEGKFIFVNKSVAAVYETTPENMQGKTDADFNSNKKELEFFLQKDREAMETGEIIYIPEETVTTARGETKIIRTTKLPIFDENGNCEQILGISVDITESKRIERDLRESETKFRAIFEHSHAILTILDKDGYIIQQNRSLLEGNPEEYVGVPAWESRWFAHDKKIMAEVKEIIKKIAKGETVTNNFSIKKTPESISYMTISTKPIYAENNKDILFLLAETREITELMLSQQALGNKVAELNIKNEELKKYINSNMQLENFAYITSHDLREPLRTISGFAKLLDRKYTEKLDETGKEYLKYILTSTKNMNALIEDLLIFSRVHTGEHKVGKIDLNALLKQIKKSLNSSIQETNAKIQFKNIPKIINANETKMKQLFQNLISNAIKFRKADIAPEIIIHAKSKGKFWEFSVQDNGIGISDEYFDKIFMIFKRLHTKDEYEGTGIGLSLCKKIVEQHGGEIHLESKIGEGTTFYFTLEK